MRLSAPTLILLIACADKQVDTDDSEAGVDSVRPVTLSGQAAAHPDALPYDPLSVGLVEVVFSEGPLLGGMLAAAALPEDGAYTLTLPSAPPASALRTLSEAEPELVGAVYALVVWEDADGDAAWSAGERVAAFSLERLVLWLDSQPASRSWPLGWSGVDTGLPGPYEGNRCLLDTTEPLYWRESMGYPQFYALDPMPSLLLRGLPVTLDIAGEAPEVPEGVTGVVGLAYDVFSDGPRDPIYDVPLVDGAFAAHLSEPVGEDHYVGADPSWRVTYHLNLLYADQDEDGAFTYGVDDIEGTTTCVDGQRVYVRYTKPVTDWRGFRLLECYGGVAGWRPLRIDASSNAVVYMSSEAGASLVADASRCRVDGG